MKKNINEGKNYNGVDTHFAVNKKTNLIVFSWDYSDVEPSELTAFKRDYFTNDLKEFGFNPSDYRILTYKGCMKQQIDPSDDCNWSDDGITPCCDRHSYSDNDEIKISESQLRNIIRESVNALLNERQ